MIESYIVLAERIKKELDDLERLVSRAKRAIKTAQKNPQDTDLYLDSASLNLHDVYSGKLLQPWMEMFRPARSGTKNCSNRWAWIYRRSDHPF